MKSELEKELNKGYKLKEVSEVLSAMPFASMSYMANNNDEMVTYVILAGMFSMGMLALGICAIVYGDKIAEKAKKAYHKIKR